MKNILLYGFVVLGMLGGTACSSADGIADADPRPVIRLSTGTSPGSPGTRALEDFPNGGSIGVLAGLYDPTNTDTEGNILMNWGSYPEIVDAPARATGFTAPN